MFLKSVIKRAFIVFFCGLLFFATAYAYLHFNFNKNAVDVEKKDYAVPYNNPPESKGIVFLLPDNSAVMTYMDFKNSCINIVSIENYDITNDLYYGYTSDFIITASYELIGGIIDRVGGINIEFGGEMRRYTGVQVIDSILNGSMEFTKEELIIEIFSQISKNGFLKDDFIYLIENSQSNLSYVDCIYWIDYIKDMSANVNLIN